MSQITRRVQWDRGWVKKDMDRRNVPPAVRDDDDDDDDDITLIPSNNIIVFDFDDKI